MRILFVFAIGLFACTPGFAQDADRLEKSAALYTTQRFDESFELCEQILKKHPDNAECRLVYVNYASAFEREGPRATKNLKVLLQLLGSNVEKSVEKSVTISLTPQALDTKEKGVDELRLAEFRQT